MLVNTNVEKILSGDQPPTTIPINHKELIHILYVPTLLAPQNHGGKEGTPSDLGHISPPKRASLSGSHHFLSMIKLEGIHFSVDHNPA